MNVKQPASAGFKAKARKHRKDDDGEKKSVSQKKAGRDALRRQRVMRHVRRQKNWVGDRFLLTMPSTWAYGYGMRKGRVRVCKPCYRKWKKENKNDDMY